MEGEATAKCPHTGDLYILRDGRVTREGGRMIPFFDLAAQRDRLRVEIDAGIARVLDHGKYILGPEVEELEKRLVDYSDAKYCVTCANGTDALQVALMALGVGAGDGDYSQFSYIATAEATALLGGTPVYVDMIPSLIISTPT